VQWPAAVEWGEMEGLASSIKGVGSAVLSAGAVRCRVGKEELLWLVLLKKVS